MECGNLSWCLNKHFFPTSNREKSLYAKDRAGSLARAVEQSEHLELVTRLGLYEQFVTKWFERTQERLEHIRLSDEEDRVFNYLAVRGSGFVEHCFSFNQNFAVEMYKAQVVVVEQPTERDESDWRAKFLGDADEKTRLLRFNSPLTRVRKHS